MLPTSASAHLWLLYLEDDVDAFRSALAHAHYVGGRTANSSISPSAVTLGTSPGRALATSPQLKAKGPAKSSRHGASPLTLTRADINSKDRQGMTILHHIASSISENAFDFAAALLELPFLDLYVQDSENGWTALHRALYHGNVALAHAFMERDIKDIGSSRINHAGGLIKIKDHDGNSPFDVYNATTAPRSPHDCSRQRTLGAGASEADSVASDVESSADCNDDGVSQFANSADANLHGEEVFTFGSNKNLNLGSGDEDDRAFPERIVPPLSVELLQTLLETHCSRPSRKSLRPFRELQAHAPEKTSFPAAVAYRNSIVRDVQIAKFHTAVLTDDPHSNLHVCGFGAGGRLGTGDNATQFNLRTVQSGGLARRKVSAVALGQSHTVAVMLEGDVWSWGSNTYGQLGYATTSAPDDNPTQLVPRQIFGALKREKIQGCAASAVHSVVFTNSSLFTFGKNDGQLGLIDADAALLQIQNSPRKVAASLFSSAITMISAIDRATICLLETHDVWVFTNYGYSKLSFDTANLEHAVLNTRQIYTMTSKSCSSGKMQKICSGGSTICALSRNGEVFTVQIKSDLCPPNATSTTNPGKIRGSLGNPQRVWSPRSDAMNCQDVAVGSDGSIILCTRGGSVWRRVKRAKLKAASGMGDVGKDHKFSRVPGLTRIAAVRSNAFGAFAAIRRDVPTMANFTRVAPQSLWAETCHLLPLGHLRDLRQPSVAKSSIVCSTTGLADLRAALINEADIESLLCSSKDSLGEIATELACDGTVGSSLSDIRIPCHTFLISGRSAVLRAGMDTLHRKYYHGIPDLLSIEYDGDGRPSIIFSGVDVLALICFVFYLYTDSIVDYWNHTKHRPVMTARFRQVRIETIKLAAALELKELEQAARLMREPMKTLHTDLDLAMIDASFFQTADVKIQLQDASVLAHRALLCRRCPFFDGLFQGHSDGAWLGSRRDDGSSRMEPVDVDFQHVREDPFSYVLRYLYTDLDECLFEDVQSTDLDAFLDLIMEVLSVANELMLDRLAQVCQKVLASHVNMRNVCSLLNAVAPCAVTDFKSAAFEYICLNLEGMLENRFLDELDEDLWYELDAMVQANQQDAFPISRSNHILEDLEERYPDLADQIGQSRQQRIEAMRIICRWRDDSSRAWKSSRVSDGSSHSPTIMGRMPTMETLFDMDEDTLPANKSFASGARRDSSSRDEISQPMARASSSSSQVVRSRREERSSPVPFPSPGMPTPLDLGASALPAHDIDPPIPVRTIDNVGDGSPWAKSTSFKAQKMDLKNIMAQASENRVSSLSTRLLRNAAKTPAPATRLSQKERKRQQYEQQQQRAMADSGSPKTEQPSMSSSGPAWQMSTRAPRVSMEDVLSSTSNNTTPSSGRAQARAVSGPPLTLRQTVAGSSTGARKGSAPSTPSRMPPTATRAASSPISPQAVAVPSTRSPPSLPTAAPRQDAISPRSVQHNARPSPSPTQRSMANILAEQQDEKDSLREAALAKRSLREIQEEQAFQEWWDQEAASTQARMQADEAAVAAAAKSSSSTRNSGRRSHVRVRDRGDAPRGRGSSSRGGRQRSERGQSGQKTSVGHIG